MDFFRFYEMFHAQGVVSSKELSSLSETFDKNNLTRWCHQGWLIKLRNGFYAFPELANKPNFIYFIANQIYGNSYVSLYSALIYHRYLPPQFGMQVSSVSDLKTNSFRNPLGRFDYQKMKPELLFGYIQHEGDHPFRIAGPEKALLDLFYLYPAYYAGEQEMRNFALDHRMMYEDFQPQLFYEYLPLFENLSLEKRVAIFARMYGI